MNPIRLPLVVAALVAITAYPLRAADPPPGAASVQQIRWTAGAVPSGGTLKHSEDGATEYLSIAHPDASPTSIALWSSEHPGIQSKCYAVRGRVRYQEVKGAGYLEMWSTFPSLGADTPGGKYFSRTLATEGPLAKIEGSSEWRPFFLPFDGTQAKSPPSALNLNLVLAGPGSVDLADVELLQFADSGAMWASLGQGLPGGIRGGWWLNPATLAAVLGFLLLATFAAGMLVRRRKAEVRRMRALDLS